MTRSDRAERPLLGAVLAGGRSSRFGSDKATAEIRGARLLDRAVDVLRAVCDDVVVVSSRPEHAVPGATRVPDTRTGLGPLAGIEAALTQARALGASAVFVLACDLPSVEETLVRRVSLSLGDAPAVAPGRNGPPGFEPLCAVYRVSCLDTAARLLDEGRLEAAALFDEVAGRVVDGPSDPLANLNTRQDLAAWEAREDGGEAPRREGPAVVCVIGKKKSGKTTTVVGLVGELVRRGRDVVTVKHGHGFSLDQEGTDSWKHRHVGGASRVVLAGPEDFAVLGRWGRRDGGREPSLETLVARFGSDADIVVAEGFKAASYPCIEVYRTAAHVRPLLGDPEVGPEDRWIAVLTDDPSFTAGCPVLDVDDPERFGKLADLVEART